jgi:hypothetical protein
MGFVLQDSNLQYLIDIFKAILDFGLLTVFDQKLHFEPLNEKAYDTCRDRGEKIENPK